MTAGVGAEPPGLGEGEGGGVGLTGDEAGLWYQSPQPVGPGE